MALKSKLPLAGASRGGKTTTLSLSGEMQPAGVLAAKKSPKRRRTVAVETIEARLAGKAEVADTKAFATMSLGQMTREKRHKLLYGD
jgi:uncharacterized protein YaiL (DUF2058 family)